MYLPLHRTKMMSVTEQTLTFGFRAASAGDSAGLPAVAAVADLDLMAARRHAAILAGYQLGHDLAALRQAPDAAGLRGLAAVEREWAGRGPAAGRAAMFDCALDLPGRPLLEDASEQAGITVRRGAQMSHGWQPAVGAVERALMIALVCARHHGRYQWAGTMRIGQIVAAAAWDCLPWPGSATPAALASTAADVAALAEPVVAAGNPK